jgi:lysophospholipase L1-like esterase
MTRVEIKKAAFPIGSGDLLYFGGSCFAENLHSYWQDHFLPCGLAPFGSTYNPASLRDSFRLICSESAVKEEELFLHNELWRHPLFNTLIVDKDATVLTRRINAELKAHRVLLKKTDHLVLTLGTAFVFEEKATQKIVNNCHKRPASEFQRYSLTSEEITKALKDLMKAVRGINPQVRLILTLSPVRHLRDKAWENSLSKALLRCGLDEYLKHDIESQYFPSFEIMMDELRDYRWYADDLVHPSETALGYIMEQFREFYGDKDLNIYLQEAETLAAMHRHRILHPDTAEGRKFNQNKESKTQEFIKRYPFCIRDNLLR